MLTSINLKTDAMGNHVAFTKIGTGTIGWDVGSPSRHDDGTEWVVGGR